MSTRNYNMSDTAMTEWSGSRRLIFIDNKADFSNFDSDFADPFAADWDTATLAAIAVPTSEQRDDQSVEKTDEVLALMAQARLDWAAFKYFVEKAYINVPTPNRGLANRIGLNEYQLVGSSQEKMVTFLTDANAVANETAVNTTLNNAGCTDARINALLTSANALRAKNNNQNQFVTTEPGDTHDRITILNACWLFAQQVNAASKAIFANDPIRLNYFTFPRNTEPVSSFNIIGKAIADDGTDASGVLVRIPALNVETLTDDEGNYGFAGIPIGPVDIEFSKTDLVNQTLHGEVTDGATLTLNVTMVHV